MEINIYYVMKVKRFDELEMVNESKDEFDIDIKIKIDKEIYDKIINAARDHYPDGNYTKGLVTNRLVEDVVQEVVNDNLQMTYGAFPEILDRWLYKNLDTVEDFARMRTEKYKKKFS